MMTNEIKIKIFLAKTKSDTLAYVNIEIPLEIEGVPVPLSISNFRVMTDHYGKRSCKVLPPQIKSSKGEWKKIVFLQNEEIWHKLENLILIEYENLIARQVFNQPKANDTS